MLVLVRQEGEALVVGDGPDKVVVTVVRIKEGSVKLGFEARREIPVVREELLRGWRGRE